jgi:D-tyrosyl-tRNA(Tyr) deacylase
MRLLLQRVTRAQVFATGDAERPLASVERGLVVFAGFEPTDTEAVVLATAQKLRALRLFSDAERKMNLAAADVGARYLVTSQFTLYGDVSGGNRPYFGKAAGKEQASALFLAFVEALAALAGKESVVHTPFGADLQVALVNDGPVTLWIDSRDLLRHDVRETR